MIGFRIDTGILKNYVGRNIAGEMMDNPVSFNRTGTPMHCDIEISKNALTEPIRLFGLWNYWGTGK